MLEDGAALGLTADLLSRLDRLSLPSRRPMAGAAAGHRRSSRTGSSVEFADFRSYVPGDDFRRIDWNAYARLDRLMIRLYAGEEDICISLWLDVSRSMDWGVPPKAHTARGLAGALAYVSLRGYDRVAAVAFAGEIVARTPALRGRRQCPRLWRALAGTAGDGGETDFRAVARAARSLPRGIAIVISDFLTESGPATALTELRSAGHQVVLLQVLAPQELKPDLRGDLRLVDVESHAAVEITATPDVLAAYGSALQAHTGRLAALAASHGATYLRVSSDVPLSTLLLTELPRAGILNGSR